MHGGRSAGSPQGETRAGRAARNLEALNMIFRNSSRRPGAVSVKMSLGTRCGVEGAPRGPRRQPRQLRQRACAPWLVGWFSTRRSACGPPGTGFKSHGQVKPKPKHSTWRGCVELEPRPTAWNRARSALAAKTTTPSPPARACSVGGRPVLHRAKRARATRHRLRKLWIRCFKAAAAGLAQYR